LQQDEYRRSGFQLPGEVSVVKAASQMVALHGYRPGTPEYDTAVAQMVALHHETKSRVPTGYESPHWFGLTELLVQEVEKAARARSLVLSVTPLFGTVPSGLVGATTF
jgi:hypothetical protein